MPDLKLSKLPDRTPVKITVIITPDLNRALHAYAELYRESYGKQEPVPELIPYMLQSFLESDRDYARAMKDQQPDMGAIDVAPLRRGRHRRRNSPRSSAPRET
jgi:hypothetical protein